MEESGFAGIVEPKEQQLSVLVEKSEVGQDVVNWKKSWKSATAPLNTIKSGHRRVEAYTS